MKEQINILVSNFDNSGENVMIFCGDYSISTNTIERALKNKRLHFDDVCYVPTNEVQYYVYDPLWVDANFYNGLQK